MALSRNTGQVLQFFDTCKNCSSTDFKLYIDHADNHFLVYCDVCNWSLGLDDSVGFSEEDEGFGDEVTCLDLLFCNTKQLLQFVDTCNECNSTNLITYIHVKDNIISIYCEDCQWSFGLDDSADYHLNFTEEEEFGKLESVEGNDLSNFEEPTNPSSNMDPEIEAISNVLQLVDTCNQCSSDNLGNYIDNETDQFMLVSCNDCHWFCGIDDTTGYHVNFSKKNDGGETKFTNPMPTETNPNGFDDQNNDSERANSFLNIILSEVKKITANIGNRRFYLQYDFGRQVLVTFQALMSLILKVLKQRGILSREITSYDDIEVGDHISCKAKAFKFAHHHAIVTGVDKRNDIIHVIDYNGNSRDAIKTRVAAKIQRGHIKDPFKDKKIIKHHYLNCLPKKEVIERAISRLGETKYHLLKNNCEHFATWCKTGKGFSLQVENVKNMKLPDSHIKNS